ncbi:CotS family spore coat protein [Eubacterium multiforme]|uniref:CotS family spore coat protein n=1 Tax=Eubacterium multiforme TaxID=83339 RepID=A0ABT9UUV8_9FIRM|nr:CotS family spore coat protein [Eubacterium multiforme]MDQ0150110.1 CotS family spore coat protein [Eubacterium multiforme]
MIKNKNTENFNIFAEENIKKFILIHYGLEDSSVSMIKFKDTDKQRAVYKVHHKGNDYCLKKVYFDKANLLFVYSALEWLYKNGIKTPKFLNSLSGNKFVKFNDMYFILTIWIDGIKCDFDNSEHLITSIKQLAGIHSCSRNFSPIEGSEKRIGFSDYYISILKHFNQLLTCYNTAFKINDNFSNEYINNFDDNLKLAKWALYLSSNINNKELSSSLCHGDYVNKNIIFDLNSKIWTIDLDKCKIDYSAHDLGYFLRRLLRRGNTKFDVELTLSILRAYNEISPLTPSDIRYVLAYVCFPQKFWKLSRDYYKNIKKCNKDSFLHLLKKTNEKTYFQLKFIEEIYLRIKSEYGFNL